MADTTDYSDWSDINGHYASDATYTEAFENALREVKEVSLSFGGNCFARGVTVTEGTGAATFQLLDYKIE